MTLTLRDGSDYPHSYTLEQLARVEDFILSFPRTVTLYELSQGDWDPDAVCVRHDVDHDARHSLRFAEREAAQGIRATYALLPSAPYFRHDAKECGLAIQALGHEVALHCDAYTTLNGNATGALALLKAQADEMRRWGFDVRGGADHGAGAPLNVDLWRVHGHRPEEASLEYEAYDLMQRLPGKIHYLSDSRRNGTIATGPLEKAPGKMTCVLVHWGHFPFPEDG